MKTDIRAKAIKFENDVFNFLENDLEFKDMVIYGKFKKVDEILEHTLNERDDTKWREFVSDKAIDDKIIIPMVVGGLSTATLSNKSNAKSLNTCSLKCPTFNEV